MPARVPGTTETMWRYAACGLGRKVGVLVIQRLLGQRRSRRSGRDLREPLDREHHQVDVEAAFGVVTRLSRARGRGAPSRSVPRRSRRIRTRRSPDPLALFVLVCQARSSGLVHGPVTDCALGDADAVVGRSPQVGRIEHPEGGAGLDHRGCLDEAALPGLGGADELVRRTDGREAVGRELLGVDVRRQVAAVAVRLPEEPRRAVRGDEDAGVDRAALGGRGR